MERIKRLNWYQKSILIFMLAMALVFAVVYHMTDDRARGRFVSERDFCSR